MNQHKGFAPVIIVLIIVAVFGAGAGGYVYVSKKSQAKPVPSRTLFPAVEQTVPSQKSVPAESPIIIEEQSPLQTITPSPVTKPKTPESVQPPAVPTPAVIPEAVTPVQKISGQFIGLWKAEKLFGFNPQSQQWEEGKLLFEVFFEFKTDGTACGGGWTITDDGYRCGLYYPYVVTGDVIEIPKSSSRYKWRIVEGKLEMTAELGGTPFLRYIASKTTVVATTPAPKSDFTKPVVQSFEVTIAVNPATDKKEATLKCRAIDDTAIKYIWLNVVYAGENISWTRTPQVDDVNIRDQTWTAPGFDAEKPGTHTATCKADDAAGNASASVEKTFTVSLTSY